MYINILPIVLSFKIHAKFGLIKAFYELWSGGINLLILFVGVYQSFNGYKTDIINLFCSSFITLIDIKN